MFNSFRGRQTLKENMSFQPTHRVFKIIFNNGSIDFCFLDLIQTDQMSIEEIESFLKKVCPKYRDMLIISRMGTYCHAETSEWDVT